MTLLLWIFILDQVSNPSPLDKKNAYIADLISIFCDYIKQQTFKLIINVVHWYTDIE